VLCCARLLPRLNMLGTGMIFSVKRQLVEMLCSWAPFTMNDE